MSNPFRFTTPLLVVLALACSKSGGATDAGLDADAIVPADLPADLAPDVPLPNPGVATLGRIAVRGGHVMDEYGREWLLRGVNAKFETLFDVTFPDGRVRNEALATFDAFDAPETARLGYGFVRLAISWSGLEPAEGQFSQPFLDLLDHVVAAYEAAGVYVLIDFHEDSYSKEIGEDGAPLWAILPPPTELLHGPLWAESDLKCPCENSDNRRISGPVTEAFTSFFENTDGIQDRFLPAWRLVTGRYKDHAGMVGFEAMNEPMAIQADNGLALLDDFHVKAAAAMREVNPHHAYWLEPEVVTRNWGCEYPLRATPFPDTNVVYEPHFYPGLCLNLDKGTDYASWYANMTTTFDSMVTEAASYGAAPVLGEWWARLRIPGDFESIDAMIQLADERAIGLTQWHWRGFCPADDCTEVGTPYYLSLPDQTWTVAQPGTDRFAHAYPMAVPGHLAKYAFDRATGVATIDFDAAGGEAAPMLHLPTGRYPDGATVTLDGAPVEVAVDAATRRALLPWDGRSGHHEIVVTPKQGAAH